MVMMPQQVLCKCGGEMKYGHFYWPAFNEYEDFYKCTTCERVMSEWEVIDEIEES